MAAPWLRRKRRCDNCRHWIKPDDPQYMGECRLSVDENSMCRTSVVLLRTAGCFYCCQWQRAEA